MRVLAGLRATGVGSTQTGEGREWCTISGPSEEGGGGWEEEAAREGREWM